MLFGGIDKYPLSGIIVIEHVFRLPMVRNINHSVRLCFPLADGADYKSFGLYM